MARLLPPALTAAVLGLMLMIPAAAPAQAPPGPRPPAPAPGGRQEEELVEKVRKAIERGVKNLERQQLPDGSWEGLWLNVLADMKGGSTALVTLALLNCGVRPEDRSVARALDYLAKLPPEKTYVVGLQNMVFAEVRQEKYLPLIQRNADWLITHGIGWKVNGGRVVGGQLDGWSYPQNAAGDNSNTQYALLGLYAAKQAGAKIDDSVWAAIQEYYTRTQTVRNQTSGSWAYHNAAIGDRAASFTMTVAGVCGLYIAGMGREKSPQELDEATGVARKCGVYDENGAIARGTNWIAERFNFNEGKSQFYNFYGVERMGRLSGQRFIGKYDWYREGCKELVAMQQPDGSFTSRRGGIDAAGVIPTAFALLFLSKGRTPVLISKFAWGDFQDRNGAFVEVSRRTDPPGAVNWNRKHNDARNMVEYCSRELFKGHPLAWQAYDVRRQDLSDPNKLLDEVGTLIQSPVLYINGHGPFTLTGTQEELLKKYVEEGGFIIGEACCGDAEFTKSFRELAKKIAPGGNGLQKLDPAHAIWRSFHDVSPADFPDLEGLEKGCRTVMVFSPKPLAGYWEESRFVPEKGKPAKNQGERAFRLAGNIIAYATGLELPKPRLTHTKLADVKTEVLPRSYLKVAQLQEVVGQKEPDAPGAVKNLMQYLRSAARLEVVLDKEFLPPSNDNIFRYKFMYLHGRKPVQWDELAVENLRSNLQTGGILLADAGCNGVTRWREFDKSFRENVEKVFPGAKLEVIQPTRPDGTEEPLFKMAREAGLDIRSVKCRREKADGSGPESELRSYPPYLEGIRLDGRWVVVYSKYDLGCALEGHKSSDCLGHDRDSALKIGAAVVLYALKR
jgi:hypothetical protein